MSILASLLGQELQPPEMDPALLAKISEVQNFQFLQPQPLPQNTGGEAVMGTLADIFANNAASKDLANRQNLVKEKNEFDLNLQKEKFNALRQQINDQLAIETHRSSILKDMMGIKETKARTGLYEAQTRQTDAEIGDLPLKRKKLQAEAERAEGLAEEELTTREARISEAKSKSKSAKLKAEEEELTFTDRILAVQREAKKNDILLSTAQTEAQIANYTLKAKQLEVQNLDLHMQAGYSEIKKGNVIEGLMIIKGTTSELLKTGDAAKALDSYIKSDQEDYLSRVKAGVPDDLTKMQKAKELSILIQAGPLHALNEKMDNELRIKDYAKTQDEKKSTWFQTTPEGTIRIKPGKEDEYMKLFLEKITPDVRRQAQLSGELDQMANDLADALPTREPNWIRAALLIGELPVQRRVPGTRPPNSIFGSELPLSESLDFGKRKTGIE